MKIVTTALTGVLVFEPTPFHDARGFFSRTFDAAAAVEHGLDPAAYVQESQSRTRRGIVRGLHGRAGDGEGKVIRCARGAAHLVVVDARPASAGFGRHVAVLLDDEAMASVAVPSGMLVGFQALTDWTDVCYKVDRPHCAAEDVAVRHDDPALGIAWPLPVSGLSDRDRDAPAWAG